MKKEELFQKFKLAIENEYDAFQLYSNIAEISEDPELRVIFQKIAGEELEHRNILMQRYKILKESWMLS